MEERARKQEPSPAAQPPVALNSSSPPQILIIEATTPPWTKADWDQRMQGTHDNAPGNVPPSPVIWPSIPSEAGIRNSFMLLKTVCASVVFQTYFQNVIKCIK